MSILDSNRDKHFLYAIPIGLFLSILCVVGVAFALEFKDKCYGNKFDWLDALATILGGIVGQLMQILIVYLIIK